jgi:DNA modification methylase
MPSPTSAVRRDLTVTYVPIDSLKPYANNARRHSRKQLRKIARSLDEFGWTNPPLISREGEILCGHGRVEAAKLRGDEEVPVIVIDDLTETQRRAYVIADNELAAQSSWDRGMLATELQGLIELGYDVELTAFDTIEIDTLLSVGDDEPSPENELVELPADDDQPLTRLGDHWVFADRHHLLCADARLSASFEALLQGERAELVVTDPPFNTLAERISGSGQVKHGPFVAGSGELTDSAFVLDFLRPVLRNIQRFSSPGTIGFICCDWRTDPLLREAAAGVFAEMKNFITWAKTNAGMGTFYRSQTEFMQAWKISQGPTINNFGLGEGGRHRSNLWVYAGANTFRRGRMEDLQDHPTVKPTKMIADAVLDCSRRDGLVLDPFLGSGTLLAAAAQTGRRGYGLELDPRFCDVILRRMADATGCIPTLLDGTPLEVVREQREAAK